MTTHSEGVGDVDPLAGEVVEEPTATEEATISPDASAEQPVGQTDESGSDGDAAASSAEPDEPVDELTATRTALAERTVDLQRLQAEYVNYKRRVERDRELIRENATYSALSPIVEVLDNIDRAREHGPLEDGFKAVAEQLERIVGGLGLVKFGSPGDVFDPTIHEALSHLGEDPEVAQTTAKVVAKAGYKIGDRVLRAAQVLVVDPPAGGGESD